jgi:hypothetical protein
MLTSGLLHRLAYPANEVDGVTVKHAVLTGSALSHLALVRCRFASVELRGADLTSTTFKRCRAEGTKLENVAVDPANTRLDIKGLDPSRDIRLLNEPRAGGVHHLVGKEALAALRACGALPIEVTEDASLRRVEHDVRDIVEKLNRAYFRAVVLCEEDDNLDAVWHNPTWPAVAEIMLEHGVLTTERRNKSGAPYDWYRLRVLPDDLWRGEWRDGDVDARVRACWDALEHAFPEGQQHQPRPR